MVLFPNLTTTLCVHGAAGNSFGILQETGKDLFFTTIYLAIHQVSDWFFNICSSWYKNREYMFAGEEFINITSDFDKFSFDEAMSMRIEHIIHDTLEMSQASFLLFYGPSGTGKTALSRHIAQLLFKKYDNFKIFLIQGGVLAANSENVSEVENLFKKIRSLIENGYCVVLVIDECEAFFYADSGPSELVLSFLNLFDNISDYAKSNFNTNDGKFTIIATCNEVNKIPEAVTRRGKPLFFNMCSKDVIVSIFRYFIVNKIKVTDLKFEINNESVSILSKAAEIDTEISGGNIKNIVEEGFSYYIFLKERMCKSISNKLDILFTKIEKNDEITTLKKNLFSNLYDYKKIKSEELLNLISNLNEKINEDELKAQLQDIQSDVEKLDTLDQVHVCSILKYWCLHIINRISISDAVQSEELFKKLEKMYNLIKLTIKADNIEVPVDIKYLENSIAMFKKSGKITQNKDKPN